jgi:Protein of unknown function with PCYCGC motif
MSTRARRLASAVAGAVIALLLAGFSGGSAARKSAEKKASRGCAACREKRPVLDPAQFSDPAVRAAYEVARKYPKLLDRIHCFCECEENPNLHHKNLLTCYTSDHAAHCDVCMHEANLAGKMKREGASDDEIVSVVETLSNNIPGHPMPHGEMSQ